MKRIALLGLLLPFIFACTEYRYTASNQKDVVTVKGNGFVNDYGHTYTVVSSEVKDGNWKVQDSRCYIIFDVLNINYDINLKEVLPSVIKYAAILPDGEFDYGDPISVWWGTMSGGYFDIGLDYYQLKSGAGHHEISFFYKDDPGSDTIHFYISHDGNGETPEKYGEKELEEVTEFISVPVKGLASGYRNVYLHILEYSVGNTGAMVPTEKEVPLSYMVLF